MPFRWCSKLSSLSMANTRGMNEAFETVWRKREELRVTDPWGGSADWRSTSAAVPGRVRSIDCRTWLLKRRAHTCCKYSSDT